MSWYSAGTITAVKNSKTLQGSGTQWVRNIRVGEAIQIGTALYQITNVASDTSLSIDPAFAEASGAGKTYRVIPFQGYVKKLADEAARLLLSVDEQISGFEEIAKDVVAQQLTDFTADLEQSIEQFSQDLTSVADSVKYLPLGNGYISKDVSAPGTLLTLDLSTGTVLRAELTAPSTVIAIDGATTEIGASRYATIILRQGTGSNKVEWPANIRWSYGNPPVLSFEHGQEDVITLMNIGGDSHWYGFLSGGWIHA